MDRRTFMCSVAGGLLAAPLTSIGQQQGKAARVGFLTMDPREAMPAVVGTIVDRLRELGYVEGRNVIFDFRNAHSEERFRELAMQFVGVGIQVIFAQGPYALRAARVTTATLPIVGIDNESDPIAAGYATNLGHPGGNVTGVFLDQSEVSAKQLQLLKETVPGLTRVAVLWDDVVAAGQREAVDNAARKLGVTVRSIVWLGPNALPEALRSATQDGARGLIVLSTPRILNSKDRPIVATAALKSGLPAVGLTSTFARDGLLMAYGPIQLNMYRSAATMVAKILDGARPADIPIERPTTFNFVINMKTAKALGLTIPQSVLARADEVIQ